MTSGPDFHKFKRFLVQRLAPDGKTAQRILDEAKDLNSLFRTIDLTKEDIYRLMAEYLELKYVSMVDLAQVNLEALSERFMVTNLVVALRSHGDRDVYLLGDPFNWTLLDTLRKHSGLRRMDIAITEPEKIASVLIGVCATSGIDLGSALGRVQINKPAFAEKLTKISLQDLEKANVVQIADAIIYEAVQEGASDIHLEPKAEHILVRYRVYGDLKDVLTVHTETGVMVLARMKALGRLDIAERHKPQDGALEVVVDNRMFKLRLATSSTPLGESLIIRILEPEARQRDLVELGMTPQQAQEVLELANKQQGLLLLVGPIGSGKTTTLYNILSKIDLRKRSLLSVEDPVEYTIPLANQQQVNEKAGATFEALLKSAVRQDPNIMFIGEIRDPFSAKIATDFASIGHLTMSTMHAATGTSAVFRLERLGIQRGQMADALTAVIAQRLIKKLCPHCKEVVDTSSEEYEMLSPFTDDVPSQVAHPVGCALCREGYSGREGVYEVFKFNPTLLEMVRDNKAIAEIRIFAAQSGSFLLSDHALEKVRSLILSPRDVYEKILVEEPSPAKVSAKAKNTKGVKPAAGNNILVVEDDKMTQILLERALEIGGYEATLANDGIDAMILLSKQHFDLILSDITMPNLDGFKFMEVKKQKGVETPVVFLTALDEPAEEVKAFELGAADFIRKPFEKDVLLTRIKRVLAAK
jgi:type IV pilus assembly protein PilB